MDLKSQTKQSLSRVRSPMIILMILMTKGAILLKAFKAAKFTKVFITIVTMSISVIAYGLYLGPWFGVGLVAMLFIHEMGHVLAMRIKGLGTPAPVFIPFLGAFIFAPKLNDRETEAFVGIGGPFLGSIGALACFAIWPFTQGKTAEILLLVSYVGIFLNLFNLIPLSPLDGGRITQVVGGWFKWLGVVLLSIYIIILREPGFLLIGILALGDFNGLPKYAKSSLSFAFLLFMTGFMLMGYGDQPPWVDFMDVLLGGLFLLKNVGDDLLGILADLEKRGVVPRELQREYPAKQVRIKWFFFYVVLTMVVVVTQIYQIGFIEPLLHDAAHGDSTFSP